MRLMMTMVRSGWVRWLIVLGFCAAIFVILASIIPDERGQQDSNSGYENFVVGFEDNVEAEDNSSAIPEIRGNADWLKTRQSLIDYAHERSAPLAAWLLSPEGTPPPPRTTNQTQFKILIWMFGKILEPRHLRRFTQDKWYSPWDGCSVSNCELTYDSTELQQADAVLFHLHRLPGPEHLPIGPRRPDQRWVFLTDESPYHTFLKVQLDLGRYDRVFNWSMSYRIASDVPVPYGRTVRRAEAQFFRARRRNGPDQRLVAILASNCGARNQRWRYVARLKALLGDRLSVLGRCLGGNSSTCPGHFRQECPALRNFKFYLSFENSNCREYLTEKVFWNALEMDSVPVILGAPKRDCESLLPPNSFLHVDDFANPSSLADYLVYLDGNRGEYEKYQAWRAEYRVLNEHGYFGSRSVHYCRLCEALNYNPRAEKVYEDFGGFVSKERDCTRD